MNNRFIIQYDKEKLAGTPLIDIMKSVLNAAFLDSIFKKNKPHGVSTGTETLFESDTTSETISTYKSLLRDLDDLVDKNNILAISNILLNYRANLSKSKQISEFLFYALDDLESIYYSTRPSTIIEPAPMDILIGKEEPYEDNQEWKTKLEPILKRKNLSLDLFKKAPGLIDQGIEKHAAWAFDNIYSVLFPDGKFADDDARQFAIARYIHGITHASRVASYVPVFANLYRKHGDPDALKLSQDDLKMLQIAAVFHDAAREGEGTDLWDHESAILLYFYMTRTLGYDKGKAKLIAEATANKDPSVAQGYFTLKEERGQITWGFSKTPVVEPKNIYQKIIHDADSLDIIRARPSFDANHLDFYKDVACRSDLAMDEMAKLITEARSIIHTQGDSYTRTKAEVKKKYENRDAFSHIQRDINPTEHHILHTLGKSLLSQDELKKTSLVDLTPFDKSKGLTDENIKAAIREGECFARGIIAPSAKAKSKFDESHAEMEFRKTIRETGIETTSSKTDKAEKFGNPLRSVSMLGHGAGVYTSAGFLIVGIDRDAISSVSAVDVGTGRAKKSHMAHLKEADRRPPRADIDKQLKDLSQKLKMGGESTNFRGKFKHHASHVEIQYDISRYDAIYYSPDPNLYNEDEISANKGEPPHRHSPLLQALYLQRMAAQKYEEAKQKYIAKFGKEQGMAKFIARHGADAIKPICEISGIHDRYRRVPAEELTDEKIISLWREMCTDYMKKIVATGDNNINAMSLDEIKVISMCGKDKSLFGGKYMSADRYYSDSLRKQIDSEIQKSKQALMIQDAAELLKKIEEQGAHILETDVLKKIYFYSDVVIKVKDRIRSALSNAMQSNTLFHQLKWYSFQSDSQKIDINDRFFFDGFNEYINESNFFSYATQPSEIAKQPHHFSSVLSSKAVCLFLYCQIAGLKEECKQIQEQASKFIEGEIQQIMLDSKQRQAVQLPFLFKIIKLTELFQLQVDIKPFVDQAFQNYIDGYLINKIKPTGDSPQQLARQAKNQLQLFDRLGLLTDDRKVQLRKGLEHINTHMKDILAKKNTNYEYILFYLDLNAKLNVKPPAEMITALLNNVKHTRYSDTGIEQIGTKIIHSIHQLYPLNHPDNTRLFTSLVDNIALFNPYRGWDIELPELHDAIDQLLILVKLNTDKTVDNPRTVAINNAIEAFGKLIEARISYYPSPQFTSFPDLNKVMESLNEFSIKQLKHPANLIHLFSTIMADMLKHKDSNNLANQLNATNLKIIINCHEKLPLDKARSELIMKLQEVMKERKQVHVQQPH